MGCGCCYIQSKCFYSQRAPPLPGPKNLPQNFDKNTTQLECFELFWTDEIWDLFVTETNRQAAAVKAQKTDNYVAKDFKPVTKEELKAFFGLRITMEMLVYKDRYEQYWQLESTNNITYTPGFGKVMSRDRFLAIWTMLHCVDESDPNLDKTDKIYKNRPIIDYLIEKFWYYYVPNQHLSLDEGMIPSKNKSAIRQYIKAKPVKWGLKAFMLCEGDTGYILNGEIYTGHRDDPNAIATLGATGNLVVRLSEPYHGQNYTLYTDCFYTSIALCEALLTKDTLLCGTVMTNRRGFPRELIQPMDRGDHQLLFNGECAAIAWCDKKPIFFITSTEIDEPVTHVLRYNHQEHRHLEVECPKPVKTYNQYMGGTDKNDQLTKLQRCRRHYRWPRRLTIKSFMWAVYNSHIIHKSLDPPEESGRPLTFHGYIEKLCVQLIGNHICETPLIRRRVVPAEGRLRNAPDEPIHLVDRAADATTNNRCVVCLEKNRKARKQRPGAPADELPSVRKTVFKCTSCNVFLCVKSGDDNCFKAYHTKQKYWRA